MALLCHHRVQPRNQRHQNLLPPALPTPFRRQTHPLNLQMRADLHRPLVCRPDRHPRARMFAAGVYCSVHEGPVSPRRSGLVFVFGDEYRDGLCDISNTDTESHGVANQGKATKGIAVGGVWAGVFVSTYFTQPQTMNPFRDQVKTNVAVISSTCIISIVRIFYLSQRTQSKDVFWTGVSTACWSIVELHCGIICSCLATLRPLLRVMFPCLQLASTERDGGGASLELKYHGTKSAVKSVGKDNEDLERKRESRVKVDPHGFSSTEALRSEPEV